MHGHVRREALALTGVAQFTAPVRSSKDVSGLVDGDPAAVVPVNEIALHRLQTYADMESDVSGFGRC
jgi:hypothetical protein